MYRIVTKEPGKKPEERTVEKLDLSQMQELVGGYIQMVWIESMNVVLWCDEEHKLKGDTKHNVALADKNGTLFDIVGGKIFFAGETEDGENASLTDRQVKDIMSALNGDGGVALMHQGDEVIPCPVLHVA